MRKNPVAGSVVDGYDDCFRIRPRAKLKSNRVSRNFPGAKKKSESPSRGRAISTCADIVLHVCRIRSKPQYKNAHRACACTP